MRFRLATDSRRDFTGILEIEALEFPPRSRLVTDHMKEATAGQKSPDPLGTGVRPAAGARRTTQAIAHVGIMNVRGCKMASGSIRAIGKVFRESSARPVAPKPREDTIQRSNRTL